MRSYSNILFECQVPIRLDGLAPVYRHFLVQAPNLQEARRSLRRMLRVSQFGTIALTGSHRGRWSKEAGRLPRGTVVEERGASLPQRITERARKLTTSYFLAEPFGLSARSLRYHFRLLPSLVSLRPRSRFFR
jgi:hypothetical protein